VYIQAATEGAAFGLFPIMCVVVTSIRKMLPPRNLAIGAAAVGLAGREGDLFRKVLVWSLVLALLMCVLVYLQSTAVLEWMLV
jgi:lactate permease